MVKLTAPSHPLKVLHFRQSTNIWGPEKGILSLCRWLPKHGFGCEIVIMYRPNEGDPVEHPLVAAAGAQTTPITQLDGHLRRAARRDPMVAPQTERRTFLDSPLS